MEGMTIIFQAIKKLKIVLNGKTLVYYVERSVTKQ